MVFAAREQFERESVLYVLALWYVFQIRRTIIEFISVLMVDYHPIRTNPNKCLGHEPVHIEPLSGGNGSQGEDDNTIT